MLLARGLATDATQVTLITESQRGAFDDDALPFAVIRQPGLKRLCRLIHDADIVHLAGPCLYPLLVSMLRRKSVIVEHHGYQACCPNGLLLREPDRAVCSGQFLKRRYDQCLRCEAGRIGVTASLKSVFLTAVRRKLCNRVTANVMVSRHVENRLQLVRSRVIYHGVSDCTEAISTAKGVVTFGYIGRMVAEKGLPTLLTAAKDLMETGYRFHLKMIGDGPERPALENRCVNAGLTGRVSFTGALTTAQLNAAASEIDAVILPSICEETAGLTAMEQMMRGRAVLAADIGGLREIVDGAGVRFTPGDPVHLAACMRELIKHPLLLGELGSRGRKRAEQMFQQQRMAAEHRALYERILSSSA